MIDAATGSTETVGSIRQARLGEAHRAYSSLEEMSGVAAALQSVVIMSIVGVGPKFCAASKRLR